MASCFGMTLALNRKPVLNMVAVAVLATIITDFNSVDALSTIVVVPVCMGIAAHNALLVGILLIGTAVMFCKHGDNFCVS